MEIDHISYIFGSFSRRRQSQEVSTTKRRSVEQMKISHDRSKSTPHTTKRADVVLPRAKSVCGNVKTDESSYKCHICGKFFIEPRVLPCLHTFCTRCLQDIEAQHYSSLPSLHNKEDGADSGCVSDQQVASNGTWKGAITCPKCGERSECPPGGVLEFPPNYMLQNRMVLATLNSRTTRLLCDFCTGDVDATHRCSECAANLCLDCYEMHGQQRSHEMLSLQEARRRGITKVRRQIMCPNHPERELTAFCTSCSQVICRDCSSSIHRGHVCEPAARAAKTQITNIRLALEKTRSLTDMSQLTACRFQATSKQIESQCNQIQAEIEKFIKAYKQAIEERRKELHKQIRQIKEEKLQSLESHREDLSKRAKEAKEILEFVNDLLNEGTDVEILNFVKPILRKMDVCNKSNAFDGQIADTVQFLPEEVAHTYEGGCPIYGVLTTQTVSPKHCSIDNKGLQNVRVGKCVEVRLESRDRSNSRLQRGGEVVTGELRYKDVNTVRSLNVNVEDSRDGTYKLFFVPDTPGKLMLTIYIKGQQIKDSPFPVVVRALRPHHGIFHCCSFCSSGGNKEAACGCGGTMPGGYKGCGHGHEGHPGKRHWSCCGTVLEHSECVRANSLHYQFTL